MPFEKFKLVNYTDVWGNEEGGYDVMQLTIEQSNVLIQEDCTEKDLLKHLVLLGFLTTTDRRRVRVDMTNGDMYEIYAVKDKYPMGRFEKVYDKGVE